MIISSPGASTNTCGSTPVADAAATPPVKSITCEIILEEPPSMKASSSTSKTR